MFLQHVVEEKALPGGVVLLTLIYCTVSCFSVKVSSFPSPSLSSLFVMSQWHNKVFPQTNNVCQTCPEKSRTNHFHLLLQRMGLRGINLPIQSTVTWWSPHVNKVKIKAWQELQMLSSRSLSQCQSLTLNVMIQVSQFVRNNQLLQAKLCFFGTEVIFIDANINYWEKILISVKKYFW